MKKPANYWDKDACRKEALKYNTRSEFKNGSVSAYHKATMNKWIDEICQHMKRAINPPNHWNFERCYIEALKYNIKSEFIKNMFSLYFYFGRLQIYHPYRIFANIFFVFYQYTVPTALF